MLRHFNLRVQVVKRHQAKMSRAPLRREHERDAVEHVGLRIKFTAPTIAFCPRDLIAKHNRHLHRTEEIADRPSLQLLHFHALVLQTCALVSSLDWVLDSSKRGVKRTAHDKSVQRQRWNPSVNRGAVLISPSVKTDLTQLDSGRGRG
jgi:hypothetical protein